MAKLCPTLCNPMDCSKLGFPVFHYPRVCSNSCPLSQWCHPAISPSIAPFFSCPQLFPESGFFPISWLFASGGQSIGASALASVLPMNIQNWFPLGWTGLISFLSKELSKESSSAPQFESISTQSSLRSNSHILWSNNSAARYLSKRNETHKQKFWPT